MRADPAGAGPEGVAAGLATAIRLGLAALVVAAAIDGNRTSAALGVVFLIGSLAVARIARPVFDAALGGLLLAHGWGSFLGPANEVAAWGPVLHVAVPFLTVLTLAFSVGDRGLPGHRAGLREPAILGVAAGGAALVVVAWEVVEVVLNHLPAIAIHVDNSDTRTDLALGALGIAAGLGVAAIARELVPDPRR